MMDSERHLPLSQPPPDYTYTQMNDFENQSTKNNNNIDNHTHITQIKMQIPYINITIHWTIILVFCKVVWLVLSFFLFMNKGAAIACGVIGFSIVLCSRYSSEGFRHSIRNDWKLLTHIVFFILTSVMIGTFGAGIVGFFQDPVKDIAEFKVDMSKRLLYLVLTMR